MEKSEDFIHSVSPCTVSMNTTPRGHYERFGTPLGLAQLQTSL